MTESHFLKKIFNEEQFSNNELGGFARSFAVDTDWTLRSKHKGSKIKRSAF
jgi:hypothetical protein